MAAAGRAGACWAAVTSAAETNTMMVDATTACCTRVCIIAYRTVVRRKGCRGAARILCLKNDRVSTCDDDGDETSPRNGMNDSFQRTVKVRRGIITILPLTVETFMFCE